MNPETARLGLLICALVGNVATIIISALWGRERRRNAELRDELHAANIKCEVLRKSLRHLTQKAHQ